MEMLEAMESAEEMEILETIAAAKAGRSRNRSNTNADKIRLSDQAAGRSGNLGFTLIELLIGISILSVVGVMTTMLLSAASRMYHSTVRISEIQTESQTVSRRLSRAVMDAASLYVDESEDGIVLFTGEIRKETDLSSYFGEMFWWDKESRCLYQGSHVSITASRREDEAAAENGSNESGQVFEAGGGDGKKTLVPLTGSMARAYFLEGTDSGREYLISDKLKEMSLTIYPKFAEDDERNLYGTASVNYALTFSYLDSEDYRTESSAATRNVVYMPQRKGGALAQMNPPKEAAEK